MLVMLCVLWERNKQYEKKIKELELLLIEERCLFLEKDYTNKLKIKRKELSYGQ